MDKRNWTLYRVTLGGASALIRARSEREAIARVVNKATFCRFKLGNGALRAAMAARVAA